MSPPDPHVPDLAGSSRRRAEGYGRWPAVVGMLALAGCGTYRVEYHHRPTYYDNAAIGTLDDEVTLDDGTVLIFKQRDNETAMQRSRSSDRFQVREELADGTVVLRAMLPEHVLSNTLTCLRNEEYDLLWDQMLSEQTKHAYELRGQGYEEFQRFFSANRLELAAMLTRMMLGLSRQESYMETIGGGVIRYSFHPRIGSEFKFKTVDVVAEPEGMRLLLVK